MLVLPLALMLSGQAFAYDGFVDADIATCTQGNNNVDLVTACTRLIDNAEAEKRSLRNVLRLAGVAQ